MSKNVSGVPNAWGDVRVEDPARYPIGEGLSQDDLKAFDAMAASKAKFDQAHPAQPTQAPPEAGIWDIIKNLFK